jgi:hypothetical protein
MGQITCEIETSWDSDMFTVEVRSKDGKLYQKRSSVMTFMTSWQKHGTPVKVLIYVDYGDVITATRGKGYVELTDESASEFTGKNHTLSATGNFSKKEVKVTKENVRVAPHKYTEPDPKTQKKYRPSNSVWDG